MRAVASVYRAVVVTGRWLMVAGWLAVAIALPPASPTSGGTIGADVGTLLPPESAAVTAQERSLEKFAVPVVSQVAVVVHDPAGLTILTQADVALWALTFVQAADEGRIAPGPGQIIGAVPVPSVTPEIAVTYLYFSPDTSSEQVVALATVYADHFSNQASVQTWVTGITPAQLAQRGYLSSSLGGFEIATLAMVAVVVGLVFRSFTAPIAVLAVAGLGYIVALRLLRVLADRLSFALPDDLQPLLAALLIGVVTDYCVLFLFACRDHLVRGAHRHVSAARAAMSEGPIVAVAGLTVAGGTAALLAATFPIFRAFGPAMAITVLVGLAVSVTLVPALVAILGRWLFLPWRSGPLGGPTSSKDHASGRLAGADRASTVRAPPSRRCSRSRSSWSRPPRSRTCGWMRPSPARFPPTTPFGRARTCSPPIRRRRHHRAHRDPGRGTGRHCPA